MRIICCGNRDRGDDAAGLLVAERLQELGIQVEVCSGAQLDLIHAFREYSDVLIVDAVVTGAPVGSFHFWHINDHNFAAHSWVSTHGFGVGEAISLARSLQCIPKRLRVYGIEARQFDAGTYVSAEVQEAVLKLVRKIATECFALSY